MKNLREKKTSSNCGKVSITEESHSKVIVVDCKGVNEGAGQQKASKGSLMDMDSSESLGPMGDTGKTDKA